MRKLALFGVVAVLMSSVASLAHVQASDKHRRRDQDGPRTCSVETLEGVYGISLSGTRPAPNVTPLTIEQVIGVGTQTFDGAGNFTQVTTDKGSVTGILFPNRAGSGTYTVNDDCTGTTTLTIPGLPFPIVADIVVVSNGKEFRDIIASPQAVMVSIAGRRED